MNIAVGSDHAGYEGNPPHYKPAIVEHLTGLGHRVIDCGTTGPESVDYPDFADKVAEVILRGEAERGVLLCGTGIGVSIAANRHPGIRAAVCATPAMAELARSHNNANVLCLGRRTTAIEECLQLVDIWLETAFSEGERHQRRVKKLG
jgi:ribose 5-phosphate isomerase B